MKRLLILIVLAIAIRVHAVPTNGVPLTRPYLQTQLDANLKAITNAGTIESTNFRGFAGVISNGTYYGPNLRQASITNGQRIEATNFSGFIGVVSNGVIYHVGLHAPAVTNAYFYGTDNRVIGDLGIQGTLGFNGFASTVSSDGDTITLQPETGYPLIVGAAGAFNGVRANEFTASNGVTARSLTSTNLQMFGPSTLRGTNYLPAGSSIAFQKYSMTTLANGANATVPIGTNVFVELSGNTAAVSLHGLWAGVNRDGDWRMIVYRGSYPFTIAHDSGTEPHSTNRIRIATAGDRVFSGAVAMTFIYSGSEGRWLLVTADGVETFPGNVTGNAGTAATATNLADVFYPETFGAIAGDGQDDSAAWTACWNAARTNLHFLLDGRRRTYEINTNMIVLSPYNLINRGTVQDAVFISTNHLLTAIISNAANYTKIERCWFGSTNHPDTVSRAIVSTALPQGEWAELTTIRGCYFTNFHTQIYLSQQDNPVVMENRGYGFKSNGLFAVRCDQAAASDNYFGFSYPIPIFSTNVLGLPDFYYGVGQPSWLTNSIAFQFDRGISWQMERNAINGVGQAVYADGYGAVTKFTFINNDFESVFHPTKPRLQFTNCGGLTFIGNSYAVLNGYDDHAGLEMNNCRMGQSAIINSFFGGPQTNSISIFPAAGDPSGQLPVVIGGGQSIRTHAAYGDAGTEAVIPTQGTVATTLASEGNTFKNINYFDEPAHFRNTAGGNMLNLYLGGSIGASQYGFGIASRDASGNPQAFLSYQDYSAGPWYLIQYGGDLGVGRPSPNYHDFYATGTYGTAGGLRVRIGSSGITIFSGSNLMLPTSTPASAGAAGTAGTITWDSNYIYICTAANTWKRVAIATW